jgi:co-chaperonin GroES (HSP10)
MIELPSFAQDRLAMADNRAIVVQVGDDAWSDERSPRAKPGDKVLVTKFAGFMAVGTQDGQTYRLVNDRDIFCAIEHEGETA